MDTRSLISQLVQIERRPIQQIQLKQREISADISALGNIKSKMTAFADALADVSTQGTFLAHTAVIGDTDVASVTATGEAARGSYSLSVDQLATAEKNRSSAFATAADEVKAGTISLTVGGDTVDVTIPSGATLSDVAELINNASAGVSAAVIETGTAAYLSITAQETGHTVGGTPSDAVQITESYTGTTGAEINLTEVQAAANAKVTIDGLQVERESNVLSDVLSGVTMELKKVSTAATTLEVLPDEEKVVERMQSIVDNYNDLLGLLDSSGSLQRQARQELQRVVSSAISGLTGDYVSLGSIGLTSDYKTGNLKLSADDLKTALAADPTGVAKIFTLEDTGFVASMTAVLDRYTDSSEGLVKISTDALTSRTDSMDDRVERLERRVLSYEERLTKQYTALEEMMLKFQRQEAAIASFVPIPPPTAAKK